MAFGARRLELPIGQRFEFRYLIDGRWQTDYHADGFTENGFGSHNSIVDLTLVMTLPLATRAGSQVPDGQVTKVPHLPAPSDAAMTPARAPRHGPAGGNAAAAPAGGSCLSRHRAELARTDRDRNLRAGDLQGSPAFYAIIAAMSRTNTRRLAILILAAIVLIAAALRLWRIDSLPPGFHFDESFEGLEAWRILTDPGYRPIFLAGNFGVTPLNAYANALTFALFGFLGGEAGPTAMRTTAAIMGVLGVLVVYALAAELRHLDPRRLTLAFPLLAAAVLATLRWHIHFSRIGIEPIFVPLLWAAATWLLLRGWRLQSWVSFAGCGLVLALAMYAYQGAWIIPFLMIPVVLHLWLSDGSRAPFRPLAWPDWLPPAWPCCWFCPWPGTLSITRICCCCGPPRLRSSATTLPPLPLPGRMPGQAP